MMGETKGGARVQLIFLGLIFVMLDFSVALGSLHIGLLPDFVGYYLIQRGARRMTPNCIRFADLRPAAKTFCIYSAVRYALELAGLLAGKRGMAMLLGAVELTGMLYTCWQLKSAVTALEEQKGLDLGAPQLSAAWTALLALSLLQQLLLPMRAPGTLLTFAMLAAEACFLLRFEASHNRWRNGGT